MEEDDDDPVTALEWDPLSADYLIMTNTFHPVRLIDIESGTVITEFKLPSAAANVHTLAWISGAPGMFVTGGKRCLYRAWISGAPGMFVTRGKPCHGAPGMFVARGIKALSWSSRDVCNQR
jgi:hypothetical protein